MMKPIKTSLRVLITTILITLISACGGGGGGGDGSGGDNSGGDNSGGGTDAVNNLPVVCPNIIDITPGLNIKYKQQNVHGGRGPSFLLGCEPNSKQYWPGPFLSTFPIYSRLGNEIGRFVVFDPGHRPYGSRSYSGLPGGYPSDSSTLANSALVDGSTEIYVNVKSNICFKVNNAMVDQGVIGGVGGSGSC